MRGFKTALQLCAVLLVFQAMGEGVVRLLELPLSGPVAGMLLLYSVMCLRTGLPTDIQDAACASLRHLSLLFVPAGAGLMLYSRTLQEEWQTLAIAVLGGTLCTLAFAALALRLFRVLRPLFFRTPAARGG